MAEIERKERGEKRELAAIKRASENDAAKALSRSKRRRDGESDMNKEFFEAKKHKPLHVERSFFYGKTKAARQFLKEMDEETKGWSTEIVRGLMTSYIDGPTHGGADRILVHWDDSESNDNVLSYPPAQLRTMYAAQIAARPYVY